MSERSVRTVLRRLLLLAGVPWAERLSEEGAEPFRLTPLSGGDINRVYRIDGPDGDRYLAKVRLGASNGFFQAEANGLATLRAAAALRIPDVYAVEAEGLLLEWLEPAPERGDAQGAALGRGLARLHRTTWRAFGFTEPNYIGLLPQTNPARSGWIDFYREARLLPQFELAEKRGRFGAERRRWGDRLLERLPQWIDEGQVQPSLIHGDLWGGNWLATDRGPALIDPAVAYCDREMDLAMARLFGGFPEEFYDAYDEAYSRAPGYREREPLYQLYYLLVHLNIFGETYGPAVDRVLRRYGG